MKQDMELNHILIIGAGITGSSLAKFMKPSEVLILEKEARPGGKCRSYKRETSMGVFTFDIGGHWFHCKTHEKIKTLFPELQPYMRKALVYLMGQYIDYPIQANFFQIKKDSFVRNIKKELKFCKENQTTNIDSYKQLLQKRYGTTLFSLFFDPYNQKIFDIVDLDEIQVGSYEHLRNVQINNCSGYNDFFYYFSNGNGVQQIVDKMLEDVNVQYNADVYKIDFKNRIVGLRNGDKYKYEILVNTMPLKTLLYSLNNPKATLYANILKYSSTYIYNIGIKTDCQIEWTWIYFPEKIYPFYRIGCYSIIDKSMAPSGCQALYLESTHCLNYGEICQILIRQKYIQRTSDVLMIDVHYLNVNYCFFNPIIPEILRWLCSQGIYSIGRYGNWKWSSMHEDIFEAKELSKRLK